MAIDEREITTDLRPSQRATVALFRGALRFRIEALLIGASLIFILDRQVYPILAPTLRDMFGMSNSDYAMTVAAYQLAYIFAATATGVILDRLGTRLGYFLCLGWWSLSAALHTFGSGVLSFAVFRFMLGLGEGSYWPATVKAVSEWFPSKDRAMAIGFQGIGISLGGIVAPPLTAFVALYFGWRAAFFILVVPSAVWLFFWYRMYYLPQRHPRISPAELEYIREGASDANVSEQVEAGKPGFVRLLKFPQTWGLVLTRAIADPPWQFYLFWLPEYLARIRHLDLATIGVTVWLPFVAGGAGSIAGGWISSFFIRKGVEPVRARKIAMAISASMLPFGIFAVVAPEVWQVLVLVCIAAFGHHAWIVNVGTAPADVLPTRVVGTISGISQTAGYSGNMIASVAIGYVLDNFSYVPVFIGAGILHPLATLVFILTFRNLDAMSRHFK